MTKTNIFSSLLFMAMYNLCMAQSPRFQRINADIGLSQNSVVSIAQDDYGFLWFATQDGLNKYDGTNFTQYEAFFRDKTEIEKSQLGKIFVDENNRIWATLDNGSLQYFDPKVEKFTTIAGITEASCVVQTSGSEFWVGTFTNGLYKLKLSATTDSLELVVPNVTINKIFINGNDLLLATDKGVRSYNTETSKLNNKYSELSDHSISDIEKDQNENVYIVTYLEGVYVDTGGKVLTKITTIPEGTKVQDIHLDSDGKPWVASYGDGIFYLDGKHVHHYKNEPRNIFSISYDDVLSIFEDRKGNIWFGTDGGGAFFLDPSLKPIYGVTNAQMPLQAPVDVPRAITVDEDHNIWVGTSGKGLTAFDADLSKVIHYSLESEFPYNLPSDRIMSLFYDEDARLWIGTQDGGLLYKDKNEISVKAIGDNLASKTIWDIEPAGDYHLWLCSRKEGLILFDKKNFSWRQFSKEEGLNSNNLRVMECDDESHYCYLGTDEGTVIKFDTNSEQFEEIDLGDTQTGPIKSLLLDEGKLWIGTQEAGLIILNLRDNSNISVSRQNGLPNNVVYAIMPQGEDYIWISSNHGICQLDKKRILDEEENFINQSFSKENGLVSNEFNTGAYHQDERGYMYFGGIDGICWFEPGHILKNPNPMEVVLLDLIITKHDQNIVHTIYDTSFIELNYTDRNFQIRYSAQDYSSKNQTRYQYKLLGINEEWIINEGNELVNFSNIPPGAYTFLLKATNDDGLWNREPVSLEIHIRPAFWQTLWFRLLICALSVYLLWLLYKFRVGLIRKEAGLKEQIILAEAKALKSQMNPHFLFNSLNAIDNYILKNDSRTASDYLSKFSKLIRRILDNSELSVLSLAEELKTLELYIKMERMRFPDKFDYELKVSDDVETEKIKVPPLILQPFVENAIWHGLMHLEYPGKLMISIHDDGNHTICTIDDNGIGRAKANEIRTKSATTRKSHGIQITKDRLNLSNELNQLGTNILIEDKHDTLGNPNGTKVTIKFINTEFIENKTSK